MRLGAPLVLLLSTGLVACAPHDGEVTGDYVAYLAAGSSLNIFDLVDARRIDLGVQSNLDTFKLTPIDCRPLAEEDEGQRLPLANTDACLTGDELTFAPWLDDYGYYKQEGTIEPTRVEALLTSEHDLQLTVHTEVPRFGDVRFGWVIDPRFQPTECVAQEDGSATLNEVDGNWYENWSVDAGGGTQIYLNAFSFQVDPVTNETQWFLDQDWSAGASFGRFVDDDFLQHGTDYIDSLGSGLYLLEYDSGNLPVPDGDYAAWVAALREFFTFDDANPSELATVGQTSLPFEVRVEDNSWRMAPEEEQRETDVTYASGLENWVGLNTSFVEFDMSPAELALVEAGAQDKPITGRFQIYLDGQTSASKFLISGSFSLDHVSRDIWGYPNTLDETKREENNTPLCGEDRLTFEG